MSTSSPAVDGDAPIQDFSQCHAGILSKLDMLDELPMLLEQASRAREIAEEAVEFFREAIFEHHLDEERELFPAVLNCAHKGEELDGLTTIVKRLISEHRELELLWKRLESGLRKVAKGRDSEITIPDIQRMVTQYRAHAQYEEQEFLPLSQIVLARNSNDMAALGLALHMRHASANLISTSYI